jgi:hypothetical protein
MQQSVESRDVLEGLAAHRRSGKRRSRASEAATIRAMVAEVYEWQCACQRRYQVQLDRLRYDGPRDSHSTLPGKRIVFQCGACGYLHAHVRFATSELRVLALPEGITVAEG